MEREDKGRKHVPASVSFCNSVFFFPASTFKLKIEVGEAEQRLEIFLP